MQKLYVGRREKIVVPVGTWGSHTKAGVAVVRVIEADGDSHFLNPRFDLCERGPDKPWQGAGLEWGSLPSNPDGPRQLALALLADALETDYTAVRLHQQFMRRCILQMPREAWSMTANTVCRYAVVIAIGETVHEQHRY